MVTVRKEIKFSIAMNGDHENVQVVWKLFLGRRLACFGMFKVYTLLIEEQRFSQANKSLNCMI